MMRFESSRTPLTREALSSAEAEIGLRFPPGLREHYLRANGSVPDAYIFRRGATTVAIFECLPLRAESRGLSAMGAYRSLVQEREIHPPYLFPFAVDGGGNLFLVDCRSEDGAVYVWWHDEPEENLLDLRVGIADFWTYLAEA